MTASMLHDGPGREILALSGKQVAQPVRLYTSWQALQLSRHLGCHMFMLFVSSFIHAR